MWLFGWHKTRIDALEAQWKHTDRCGAFERSKKNKNKNKNKQS